MIIDSQLQPKIKDIRNGGFSMRRKDRETDKNFALEVIDRCEYGVLAMSRLNGEPYCIPLSIVRRNSYIYFHCAMEGEKIENLRHSQKVCMTCVGNVKSIESKFTTSYESAVIFGTAEEVSENNEKIEALRLICQKYAPTNMDNFDDAIDRSLSRTGIWKVKIETVTGKRKLYK